MEGPQLATGPGCGGCRGNAIGPSACGDPGAGGGTQHGSTRRRFRIGCERVCTWTWGCCGGALGLGDTRCRRGVRQLGRRVFAAGDWAPQPCWLRTAFCRTSRFRSDTGCILGCGCRWPRRPVGRSYSFNGGIGGFGAAAIRPQCRASGRSAEARASAGRGVCCSGTSAAFRRLCAQGGRPGDAGHGAGEGRFARGHPAGATSAGCGRRR